MNNIFCEFLNIFFVFYLNNILIYYKNIEEYELHIHYVLQKLRNARLYAKMKKYIFHTTQVDFLRYIISNKGLMIDSKKIQTIMN